MWGRTMPGTKQLILNGPKGYFVGGWDYPIDIHMTHVLVHLEASSKLVKSAGSRQGALSEDLEDLG